MKNKGFILINIIVIMIFLNITIMSAYIINKNVTNSSITAIENKKNQIYEKSKNVLVDDIMLDIIKDALANEELKNRPIDKITSNTIIVYIRLNLTRNYRKYFSKYDEIKEISINSNIIQNENYLDIDFFIKYDDTFFSNRHYEICVENITQEDKKDIKDSNSIYVYERYKDSIIKNKYDY